MTGASLPSRLAEIAAEAEVGQPLALPAALKVWSVQAAAWQTLKRAQTVTPHFVDRYSWGQTVITWAGSGGYWKRLTIYEGQNITDERPWEDAYR